MAVISSSPVLSLYLQFVPVAPVTTPGNSPGLAGNSLHAKIPVTVPPLPQPLVSLSAGVTPQEDRVIHPLYRWGN